MISVSQRVCRVAAAVMLCLVHGASAGDWTRPVEVVFDGQRCISYRARLEGSVLLVEATPSAGWHTFAMDNKVRAEEKLAGRKSLGMEMPTEISVANGLEPSGSWLQTPPKDFSKPELRWFSWGFEGPALFAANVRRTGPGPAQISVRGQVCTDATCKNVNVRIELPFGEGEPDGRPAGVDLSTLVRVR